MAYSSIMRNTLLCVGLFTAVFFSTYKLSEAPAIWYDEGFYTQIGANFAEQGEQLIQTAPGVFAPTTYITVGFPLIMPLSAAYTLFGVGVVQGRAVMVLFLLGFIFVSCFLARQLFGKDIAPWTVLLLASFPMLYGNGKPVLGEVPGLFFLAATLLALRYLEKTNYQDWRGYAATGALAGLCVAIKPFFLLLLGALFVTLLIKWKKISLNWYGVALGVVALLIPVGIWISLQFGADTSAASVLSDYANPYSISDLPSHIIGNALRLVTESTPLYTALLVSMWGLGIFLRRRSGISSAEIAAFIFCILTLLSYLRLEGWYRYLFPATAVSLIFLPAALASVYTFFAEKISFLSRTGWLVYIGIALLCAGHLYQTAHASYVAQHYASDRTAVMSAYLSTLKGKSVFLYNTPELAILLPHREYYQYLSPLPNVEIGKEVLKTLVGGGADVVIVSSEALEKNSEIFGAYVRNGMVDRYAILQKK
jgi:4-amino-4-deoxy-L-arabinose transferase-like glycosyltransferase